MYLFVCVFLSVLCLSMRLYACSMCVVSRARARVCVCAVWYGVVFASMCFISPCWDPVWLDDGINVPWMCRVVQASSSSNALPAFKKDNQKAVDAALMKSVTQVPLLKEYLKAKFSLRSGQFPHMLKF